jgi:hypothetical protein
MPMAFKKSIMKNIFLAFLLAFVSLIGFSQNNYSTISNRVLISGIVNNDTIIIENLKNKVALNGELGLLAVKYSNLDARVLGSYRDDLSTERSEIIVNFSGEYSWLDEQIKTTENTSNFTDEINVSLQSEEQTIPVDVLITRVRGIHGFMVIIQISGQFSALPLKEEFPDLHFTGDLSFAIALTVQVTN